MPVSPHGPSASGNHFRLQKPRPLPLNLPRDTRYGTMDSTNIADCNSNSGRRGSQSNARDSDESVSLLNFMASPHSPIIQIRDHCHQQWVAVVLTLLLLAITFYFVFGLSAPMRADHCVTPFGALLGDNGNIGAFSNCRSSYGGDRMDHFVSVGLQRLYTGSKWHALEFARRYWILSSLLTFPSLPSADYVMTLETASAVNGRRGGRGSSMVTLQRYTNMFLPQKVIHGDGPAEKDAVVLGKLTGDANNASTPALLMDRRIAMPVPRDLIVYAKNRQTLPDAHVAVVVAVRGPFRSVEAAGKDVHWYLVKNTSSEGVRPLSSESTLPRELLAEDCGAAEAAYANNTKCKTTAATASGSCQGKETVPAGVSVLYYKVYVAEQNWDNRYWKSPAATAQDQNDAAGRKSATKQRSYARVLLLHEYSKPHGFFLEDTHNNLILGWVRAPNDDSTT